MDAHGLCVFGRADGAGGDVAAVGDEQWSDAFDVHGCASERGFFEFDAEPGEVERIRPTNP